MVIPKEIAGKTWFDFGQPSFVPAESVCIHIQVIKTGAQPIDLGMVMPCFPGLLPLYWLVIPMIWMYLVT